MADNEDQQTVEGDQNQSAVETTDDGEQNTADESVTQAAEQDVGEATTEQTDEGGEAEGDAEAQEDNGEEDQAQGTMSEVEDEDDEGEKETEEEESGTHVNTDEEAVEKVADEMEAQQKGEEVATEETAEEMEQSNEVEQSVQEEGDSEKGEKSKDEETQREEPEETEQQVGEEEEVEKEDGQVRDEKEEEENITKDEPENVQEEAETEQFTANDSVERDDDKGGEEDENNITIAEEVTQAEQDDVAGEVEIQQKEKEEKEVEKQQEMTKAEEKEAADEKAEHNSPEQTEEAQEAADVGGQEKDAAGEEAATEARAEDGDDDDQEKDVTQTAATEATTEQQEGDEPTATEATTEQQAGDEPTATEATTEQQAGDEPTATEATTEQQAGDEPTATEATTEQQAGDEPTATEATTEQQAGDEPTATEATTEQQMGDESLQVEGGEDIDQSQNMMTTKEESDLNANSVPPSTTDDTHVPPAPHLPGMERSHTDIEGQMSTSALNIVWSFGLNRNVPVLNLSDGIRHAIMYPCAHVGIMYDYKNNKQHILQAHLNPITCSAVSQDKRWLVTGDVGPDAMVNIWDTFTGTPIQTMFDPNPQGGVVAVALTPDSRYLATLSALPVQTLAIWDWTVDGDVPICSADLKPEFGVQNYIEFDHTDIHHMVTNSETQVLFFHWDESTMKYFAPPLTDSDFNKPVGRYSQSIFQKGIARALTATSIGNLVVWDNNRPLSKIMDVNQSADKKPLKIIKVHDKGINVLTISDNYIVIGDTLGHVKFFDQALRLIYWYQDFHSGPCTAISFAHTPDFMPIPGENSVYPSDATKQAKPFVVRDFIVGTAIAVYCSIATDGSKMKVIHREHDAAVHALAAHPKLPIIAIGSYSGLLKLWNYRTKEVAASKMFEKSHIQCVTFDARGLYIAIGCTNGTVYVVDSVALLSQLKDPYKYAQDAITHIEFSHNSTYFATADAGFTITVYKRQRKEGRNLYIWHGRYRSHYKPIKDLIFDIHLDTNEPKLLSLGEDRMLIEYDLNFVGKTNNHVVPCSMDRIEQAAIPQCMIKYPPITKEHFFFTANDQYKLKCYNSTTKMCRKTVLGPTYGSPIRRMMIVPTTDKAADQKRLMAYITDDKVGLHFLPATGNPHLAMALIAHPSGVSNLTCSFDGAYLFTSGGPDFAVHMWEINTAALEAQCKLGGEDLVPFYGLLEGGRDGELFSELEELFYYAQLRHQGINSMDCREIGTRVPLSEVPFIMRAMGFYPSEQEIEDMLNEVKYDEYVNLGYYQEDIDLGSMIKLYVNHRPAFGLSPDKLLWAFKTLSESPELGKGGMIERGDFLDLLQKKGEHMTEFELAEHLTTLLGFNREGGSCEQEPFEAEKAGSYIAESLPYDINAEIMINEILGFSMTVDPPAADDTKDVIKSGAS